VTVKGYVILTLQKIYIINHCSWLECNTILKKFTKILSSSILEWFLKDLVTLKTGVIMLKIQLSSQE